MSGWVPPSRSVPGSELRVSDAERSQVADALSKHFADGRLDQAEFDERMQRAMSAKTRGQLAGLFDDLPPLGPPAASVVEVSRRRRGSFALVVVTLLIFMAAFSSAMWAWHFPWPLFGLIFVVFFVRSRRGWHRHGHGRWQGAPPVSGQAGSGGPPGWVYPYRRRWWV